MHSESAKKSLGFPVTIATTIMTCIVVTSQKLLLFSGFKAAASQYFYVDRNWMTVHCFTVLITALIQFHLLLFSVKQMNLDKPPVWFCLGWNSNLTSSVGRLGLGYIKCVGIGDWLSTLVIVFGWFLSFYFSYLMPERCCLGQQLPWGVSELLISHLI